MRGMEVTRQLRPGPLCTTLTLSQLDTRLTPGTPGTRTGTNWTSELRATDCVSVPLRCHSAARWVSDQFPGPTYVINQTFRFQLCQTGNTGLLSLNQSDPILSD